MKPIAFYLLSFMLITAVIILTHCKKDDSDNNNQPGQKSYVGWAVGGQSNNYGILIHTKDGGTTWERQGDSTMLLKTDLSDVSAIDNNNAWAVGELSKGYGLIIRTKDGGQTWTRQGSAQMLSNISLGGIRAINNNVAWACGNDEMILKTMDGGETWIQKAKGLFPNTDYTRLYAYDENHIWVVGRLSISKDSTSQSIIVYSSDGGTTWERQAEGILQATDLYLLDIHATSLTNVWACGRSSTYITQDGGQHWIRKTGPAANDNNGVCALDNTRAWIVADYCYCGFTTDTANTWAHQTLECSGFVNYIMGITSIDDKIAWIGNYNSKSVDTTGVLYHTKDGGKNWVKQHYPDGGGLRRISFVGDLR